MGRNTRNMLGLIETITAKGASFRSLTEGITTTGPMGRAMLTIMSAFAELERDRIVERTRAGLDAAKAKGKIGGRPLEVDATKLATIKKLTASGNTPAQRSRRWSASVLPRSIGCSPRSEPPRALRAGRLAGHAISP